MPGYLKLVVVWLGIQALIHVCMVGQRVEITGFGAAITVVLNGLMIWGIIAAFAH